MDRKAAAPADSIIKAATLAAAGVGIPGLFHPGLDEGGMALIWGSMVTKLATNCNAEISPVTVAKYVSAALSGVAAYTLGSKGLTWAASPLILAFPVAGIPAAVALNSGLNALFTLRLGRQTHRNFQSPNFAPGELLGIAHHLVGIPHLSEIRDVKQLLVNR